MERPIIFVTYCALACTRCGSATAAAFVVDANGHEELCRPCQQERLALRVRRGNITESEALEQRRAVPNIITPASPLYLSPMAVR